MTMNPNDPDRRPPGPASGTDPAYQGAKPGAFTAEEVHGFFGGSSDTAMNNAMSAALARNWWAIALRGVFAVLFGLIALLAPGLTLGSLVLLFAAYMVVDGIFDIVAAVRAAKQGERWGWLVFEGVVDLVAGAVAFLVPLATIFAVVLLAAAWAIVSGGMLFAAALRLSHTHGRWLMALGGIISVLWGILLIVWPLVGAVVMTLWLGAYALIFGIAMLVLAFRLRHHQAGAHGTAAI